MRRNCQCPGWCAEGTSKDDAFIFLHKLRRTQGARAGAAGKAALFHAPGSRCFVRCVGAGLIHARGWLQKSMLYYASVDSKQAGLGHRKQSNRWIARPKLEQAFARAQDAHGDDPARRRFGAVRLSRSSRRVFGGWRRAPAQPGFIGAVRLLTQPGN